MIGHYERQPQCPDVLRKPWRTIVEIPYLTLTEKSNISNGTHGSLSVTSSSSSSSSLSSSSSSSTTSSSSPFSSPFQARSIKFFFSGRLLLWMPERICSVRHVLATQLPTRLDTVIINITESQSFGPTIEKTLTYLYKSEFCLVTRADSYSSAFFYDALHAGCIPVVIRCVSV